MHWRKYKVGACYLVCISGAVEVDTLKGVNLDILS